MNHNVLCLAGHTSLPDARLASSGQPYPGRTWRVHSESAGSARTLGGGPCSRDSLEQEKALEEGVRTKHQSSHQMSTDVSGIHIILLFYPIWLMLVLRAREAQDARLFLYLVKHRSHCFPSVHRIIETGLRVGSGLMVMWLDHMVCAVSAVHLPNACERKLNTFCGSLFHL